MKRDLSFLTSSFLPNFFLHPLTVKSIKLYCEKGGDDLEKILEYLF